MRKLGLIAVCLLLSYMTIVMLFLKRPHEYCEALDSSGSCDAPVLKYGTLIYLVSSIFVSAYIILALKIYTVTKRRKGNK